MGRHAINNTSAWTTHTLTIEEYLRGAINTPLMTAEEWRAMYEKHYAHARLGQCPNCGANDWMPFFRIGGHYGYDHTLDHYSCAYCGTRKEK